MQYFVSSENTSYFYWQLELLIESFKILGMEDKLVIAMAENDCQKIGGFSANLVRHGNKFVHPNEGRERGYLPLNRISSLRYALAYGFLKFPFALIHADMVMRRPLEEPRGEFPIVTLNNLEDYPAAEEEAIKGEIRANLNTLAEANEIPVDSLPTVPFFSAPVVFNEPFKHISEVFFSRVQTNMVDMVGRRGADFPCEKAAWELTLAESFQYCSVSGKFMSASILFDSEDVNFLHYKTGIPPVFHKKFYRYEDGNSFSGQGPYETLMENNPTVSTDYVQRVIKSYVNSRVRGVRPSRERQTSPAGAPD